MKIFTNNIYGLRLGIMRAVIMYGFLLTLFMAALSFFSSQPAKQERKILKSPELSNAQQYTPVSKINYVPSRK